MPEGRTFAAEPSTKLNGAGTGRGAGILFEHPVKVGHIAESAGHGHIDHTVGGVTQHLLRLFNPQAIQVITEILSRNLFEILRKVIGAQYC